MCGHKDKNIDSAFFLNIKKFTLDSFVVSHFHNDHGRGLPRRSSWPVLVEVNLGNLSPQTAVLGEHLGLDLVTLHPLCPSLRHGSVTLE